MADASAAQRPRIAYVDGLRALAVLGVVVHHAAKYDASLPSGLVQHALLEGAHGVDLFFVISGLCLSYPILARLHERGGASFDVAAYFARRVVRIVPPYYAAIAVIGLGGLVLAHLGVQMPSGVGGTNVTALEIGKQLVFADRRPQFVNGSFWSLAVEWRWYFLFPLALVLWTKSRRAFATVVLACAAGAAFTRAGGFDLAILPAFMLGIVAADVEIRGLARARMSALLAVLALCVALALEPRFSLEFFRQDQPGWQLAAFFFAIAAGSVSALRAALSLRPLVWIGIASYSIYLVHEPVIALLEHGSRATPVEAALAAVVAGAAFWAIFERPFVSTPLKGRLAARLAPWIAKIADVAGIPSGLTLRSASVAGAIDLAGSDAEDAQAAAPAADAAGRVAVL